MRKESICRNCFHSYVCEQFNENKDDNNKKCHFANDHYIPRADVVPKSEVAKALNEVELLIIITKETYKQQMEDAPNQLSKQSKRTKWIAFEKFYEQFAEIKKEYTEGERHADT